jgi:hypothetical protein
MDIARFSLLVVVLDGLYMVPDNHIWQKTFMGCLFFCSVQWCRWYGTIFWQKSDIWRRVNKHHVVEFSLKSPCLLHPVFGPPCTAYPLFEWGWQSKEVLFKLGMKCWNSAFLCTTLSWGNYSSCTGRSSGNICCRVLPSSFHEMYSLLLTSKSWVSQHPHQCWMGTFISIFQPDKYNYKF